MSPSQRSPAMQAAVEALQQLVRTRYASATFEVAPAEDDPQAVNLWASVDVDDPDGVMDLVIEQVLAFQIDQGLPIHVIPVRSPQRVAKTRRTAPETRRPVTVVTPGA